MLGLQTGNPHAAQPQTSAESKALNHERFVSGSLAACRSACSAGQPPFTGRANTPKTCAEDCGCIGEQLGARISGDDLWQAFLAERGGASRTEAMKPLIPRMLMSYKACGFTVP